MILDEGCAERGCPMHDSRETKGVVFIRKEWVNLTKDEVETLSYKAEGNTWIAVELAEAKLKEKNT